MEKSTNDFGDLEKTEAEIERLQQLWIENGSYDSFKHSNNLFNINKFPRPKNWVKPERLQYNHLVQKWEPTGFLKGYKFDEKRQLAELCEEGAKYVITLPSEDIWVATMIIPLIRNIFDILVTEGLPTDLKFEFILDKIINLKEPAREMYKAIYGKEAEIDESFYTFVSIQIIKSIFYKRVKPTLQEEMSENMSK